MTHARHLQAATIDFLVGDTKPLDREDALLCMAAAMTADGNFTESINVFSYIVQNVEPEKVREAIIQSYLFCGYPRALNAAEALERAMEKAGVDAGGLATEAIETDLDNETLIKRGTERFESVYGKNAGTVSDKVSRLSPDLQHWSILEAYGRVLSRPLLTSLQRELCTVSSLMMMDVLPQLKSHVIGARNLGATDDQLWMLFDTVKKLFEAPRLFDKCRETFESVIGKKDSGMSFEEEQQYRWS